MWSLMCWLHLRTEFIIPGKSMASCPHGITLRVGHLECEVTFPNKNSSVIFNEKPREQ
jgi:hypothetical protein